MSSEAIFSWLHLSDIHAGHGAADHQQDQKLIFGAMIEDVRRHSPSQPLDALFITGDIAFSGATRSPEEYKHARDFIDEVCDTTGIAKTRVYLVPGNHDVVRTAGANPTMALLTAIRSGESIDRHLANAASRQLLTERLQNYLTFAGSYNTTRGDLWWSELLSTRAENLSIRLVGLNSALLCNDDTEKEKLQIGKRQIQESLNRRLDQQELTIVMSHHPLEWLNPADEARGWIKSFAHIILSGHVHDPQSEMIQAGGSGTVIRVSAGATHSDSDFTNQAQLIQDHLPPFGQGYSVGALRAKGSDLHLEIYPRIWSARRRRFQVDADNVPEAQSCASHKLTGFQVEVAYSASERRPRETPPALPVVFDVASVESLGTSIDTAAAARMRAVEDFLGFVAGSFERLFDLKRNSLDVHPLFKELKQRLDQMTPGIALSVNEGILKRADVRHVILRTETLLPIVQTVPKNSLQGVARDIGKTAAADLIREVLRKYHWIPASPAAFVALWDYWDRTGGWGKLTLLERGSADAVVGAEASAEPIAKWRIRVANSFLTVANDLQGTHALAAFWCGYIHGFLEYALPEIEALMSGSDPALRNRITFPAYVAIEDVVHLPDNVIETDVFEISFRKRAFSDALASLARASDFIGRRDFTAAMVFVRDALRAARGEMGEDGYEHVIASLKEDERDTCRVIVEDGRDRHVEASETIATRWLAIANGVVGQLTVRGSSA